jgi:hypothetical protein
MINETKIDHTKPVWCHAWTRDADKYKCIYLYTFRGIHYCIHPMFSEDYLAGAVPVIIKMTNIEFIKPKKSIPLDAKTCPRWPVLTHPVWSKEVELYPHIVEKGLLADVFYDWGLLFEGGYLINGLPASREVEE